MKPILPLLIPMLCVLLALPAKDALSALMPTSDPAGNVVIGNSLCILSLSKDGRLAGLLDAKSGKDYLNHVIPIAFASVIKGDQSYGASRIYLRGGDVVVEFGESGVELVLRPRAAKSYLTIEVVSLRGENVSKLTFLDVALTLNGDFEEPFSACAMALNLRTDVPQIPGLNSKLTASCYARFGFEGSRGVTDSQTKDTDGTKAIDKYSPAWHNTSSQ